MGNCDEYLRQTVVVKTTSSIVEIGVETEPKTTATLPSEGWLFLCPFCTYAGLRCGKLLVWRATVLLVVRNLWQKSAKRPQKSQDLWSSTDRPMTLAGVA